MRVALQTYLIALVVLGAAFIGLGAVNADGQGGTITGYGWSDTIGWIDLNCGNTSSCGASNFGLSIASDGLVSGYAWSDSIGWISANASDLVGCPEAPCQAVLSGSNFAGWLKALAGGSAQSGGWDGWIKLSGSNPTYGVTRNTNGSLTGYAWGSDVVGWVDFSLTTTNANMCPQANTYSCSGTTTIQYTNASCAVSNVTTCVSPLFCSPGSSTCLSPTPDFGTGGSGHLRASPSIVVSGGKTKLFWSVSNVASCTVTGTNGNSWSGTTNASGGTQSSALTQETTFTLTCITLNNSSISESVTVRLVPVFQEL